MRLKITETFFSIQGESTFAGRPSAFVRLTGCDLRCTWCDSTYTFTGGGWRTIDEIMSEIEAFGADLVCVTGGEPLLQKAVHPLMERLLDAGLTVTLETGGHRDVSGVDPRVHRIVDLKAPASGEVEKNHWPNLAVLGRRDEVKCVLADRADYEWARAIVREHALATRVAAILFSPVHGRLAGDTLAAWVLEDRLPVRLQLQLHKYLWGADARGV
ncbi:MAG: radical SAM protein [Myxococcales bacterium]|nr:radical SAM protein [Myxococcales bacterium]